MSVCPVGLSSGGLAAAIAVPAGVALLAGFLVAVCCLRRRRNQQALLGAGRNKQVIPAAARDLEAGDTVGNGVGDVQRDSWRDQVGCPACDCRTTQLVCQLAGQSDLCGMIVKAARCVLKQQAGSATAFLHLKREAYSLCSCGLRLQVKISRERRADSCNSSKGIVEPDTAGQQLTARSSRDTATVTDLDQQGFYTPASTRHNSQALSGSGGALPWHACQWQGSGGTCDGMEDRLSSVSALLKARSDAAVLRDLKIGPLLGRGSYGRVYKGRHHSACDNSGALTMLCVV
jgi:hypothetical protein